MGFSLDTAMRLVAHGGWASLSDLQARMHVCEQTFGQVYRVLDEWSAVNNAKRRVALDPRVKEIVDGVDRDGIHIARGLFADPAFLEEARRRAGAATSRSRQMLATKPPGTSARDPETGLMVVAPGYSEVVDYSPLPVRGRSRALWSPQDGSPADWDMFFRTVYGHPVVQGFYHAYWQDLNQNSQILCEHLVPSLIGDDWHIDKPYDQMKVYILLNDVTSRQGPTRYLKGSHRTDNFHKIRLLHSFFVHGVNYAYPSPRVVTALPGEEILATGRAGDAIFFDTCGIHSGTRCFEGERLTLTVYPNSFNFKGWVLTVLRQPGHAADW